MATLVANDPLEGIFDGCSPKTQHEQSDGDCKGPVRHRPTLLLSGFLLFVYFGGTRLLSPLAYSDVLQETHFPSWLTYGVMRGTMF
jgi:hypothetical protein